MNGTPLGITVEPVGGVGEMGHHHLALDLGPDSFLLDCGILMPGPLDPGINRITPSFEPALARAAAGSLRALLLTHGHLDHIGAVPDLLARIPDLPVYGTPWTLALVRRRLDREDVPLAAKPDLRTVEPGADVSIGEATATWLRVTHSLPDACSVAVRSSAGCVVHSGDFRVQDDPLLGPPSDIAGLRRVGEQGVDLALVDSTSSGAPGSTEPERVIAQRLQEAIRSVPGYVVVTLFSSHLERLWACVLAARATGRRVCVLGRSLRETVDLARERGVLPLDPGELLPSDDLETTPRQEVLLVVTGTQGEWRTPLARMARGEDSLVSLGPGDHVFWSARVIPGEERAVGAVVNRLVDRGVTVVPPWGRRAAPLHTSGHARWDEVARWLGWVRPRHVLPIHGEPWHLQVHRSALEEHLEPGRVLDLRSGQRLHREEPDADWVVDGAPLREPTLHAGSGVAFEMTDRALAHRRRAARAGAMTVLVGWTPDAVGALEVMTIGVVPDERRLRFDAEVTSALREELAGRRPARDDADRREQVRLLARAAVRVRTGTKPVCVVRLLS